MPNPPLLNYSQAARPDYNSSDERSLECYPTLPLYWVALGCGMLPLLISVGGVLRCLALPAHVLVWLGIVAILVGCFFTFVGVVCLAVYSYQGRRASAENHAMVKRHTRLALALMAVNFVLACGLSAAGRWFVPGYIFTITNQSLYPVNVNINFSGGQVVSLGLLYPKETVHETIHPPSTGPLSCTFRRGLHAEFVSINTDTGEDTIGRDKQVRLVAHDENVVIER